MPGKTSRGELLLTAEQKQMLEELSKSRPAPVREAKRGRFCWRTWSIGRLLK